jgi:hypothetical protein
MLHDSHFLGATGNGRQATGNGRQATGDNQAKGENGRRGERIVDYIETIRLRSS